MSEKRYMEKIQCPECKGTVVEIIGLKRENDCTTLSFKCANPFCHGTEFYSNAEMHFEIIEKGLFCRKCHQFNRDTSWDKNQRGYTQKCYNCGFEEFDPE